MSGVLNVTFVKLFGATAETSVLPSAPFTSTVSPALPVQLTLIVFCLESVVGVFSMPELPVPSTTPPLMVNTPSQSNVPLPSPVGPLTYTVPPLIVSAPLESSPSPEAFTVSVPPLTVSVSAPAVPKPPSTELPAAFRPSSLAVTSIVPPLMVRSMASRPSQDSSTTMVPSSIVRVLSACRPSSPDFTVIPPPETVIESLLCRLSSAESTVTVPPVMSSAASALMPFADRVSSVVVLCAPPNIALPVFCSPFALPPPAVTFTSPAEMRTLVSA